MVLALDAPIAPGSCFLNRGEIQLTASPRQAGHHVGPKIMSSGPVNPGPLFVVKLMVLHGVAVFKVAALHQCLLHGRHHFRGLLQVTVDQMQAMPRQT